MNIETAIKLYNKLEIGTISDIKSSANYYARGYARYIYFGVGDKPSERLEENLNYGSDSLAFSYLSIGCCLFENNYLEYNEEGKEIRRAALEKGAEFIEYTHFYEQSRNELSQYYLLVCALAYYGASQYSKAFVVMKKVDDHYETDVSILTSCFLKKDFSKFFQVLNKILLNENFIEELEEGQTFDERIQAVLYARAFANLMDFLHFGNKISILKAKEIFTDLLELLEIEREPSMWWVVRLMIIIVNGLEESSLWTNIPPNIPENKELANKFVNNLIFSHKPVIELFFAQRKALPKILSPTGAVVSLPTSSGKTRIAEIAILQCLAKNPNDKILYLAPFRSLAYEVESSLNQTFEKIGFVVSQLYGNGQFSQIDKYIIEDSNILIATPEKAKVILRANDTMKEQIKLVIIDEGHLLDEEERQVRNEMFIEELKKYVQKNHGKIILLSAVLPNSAEIAQWVTQDRDAFISLKERVARQRLGGLFFKNNNINLEWLSNNKPFKFEKSNHKENSFNKNFIIHRVTEKKKRNGLIISEKFPNTKKDAVALTAIKLLNESAIDVKSIKSILIFVAKANMVISHAEAIISELTQKDELTEYTWENTAEEWEQFKLLCTENQTKENKRILECAKYGILCHKRNIDEGLKIIIEKLIRFGNPKVIVGNKTLGQGVNLNISTIIVAETSFDYDTEKKKPIRIKINEFWNIVGRAGRSFIDTEGKILFVISDDSEAKIALKYFNEEPENSSSGLLTYLEAIKSKAESKQISFDDLLELIASNNFSKLATNKIPKEAYETIFDWVDDVLLAIIVQFEENPENIDDYFRQTLAYIQAINYVGIEQDDIISFLTARCKAIKEVIAPDSKNWKRLISSGLPLSSAIKLDEVYEQIKIFADEYLKTSQSIEDRIELLKKVDCIMREMPSAAFKEIEFPENQIDLVRNSWLKGESLTNVKIFDTNGKQNNGLVLKICNNYFAYTLSWFLGAVANRFRKDELEEQANVFEEIAVCCELGLPDIVSAKIYLIGIRSRVTAIEISNTSIFRSPSNSPILDFDLLNFPLSDSLSAYKQQILSNINTLKRETQNEITHKWLDVFNKLNKRDRSEFDEEQITVEINEPVISDKLFIREFDGILFACSSDYQEKIKLENQNDYLKSYINRNDTSLNFDGEKWRIESF